MFMQKEYREENYVIYASVFKYNNKQNQITSNFIGHPLIEVKKGFILFFIDKKYTLNNKILLCMKSKVIAISGALEQQSPVTNILKKCASIESKLSIELLDIKHVPLLNTDLFQQDFPQLLRSIRKKIQKSDGLIFAIPDFFGKVSPAFKNIFDWLSYSPNAQHPAPIRGMPACLISVGGEDSNSVHKHLIQMSHFCRVQIMVKPTFHFSKEKLDNFRNLQNVNASEIEELTMFLEYFCQFLAKKSKGT